MEELLTPQGYAEVREFAERNGLAPEVHPNGFVQVPLRADRTRRLHLWHSDIPRQKVRTAIHDHIFDMYSLCIKGVMRNREFGAEPDPSGDYEVHQAQTVRCTETNLFPIEQRVRLVRGRVDTVGAGESYTFPAFRFHESDADDGTVTVMTKCDFHVGTARVLVPVGAQPDNSFTRAAMPEDEVWGWVERLLS